MGKYKLTYFDGRGRAEVARLIFAASGTPYEDNRVTREEWAKIKPGTPFGQVPVLDADGFQICQSLAISRFLAKRHGLAGKGELDEAHIDMIVDCIEDLIKPVSAILHSDDNDAAKDAKKKKFAEETLPDYLDKFEKLLSSNNGGNGYFVGDGLTWADLSFVCYSYSPERLGIAVDWNKVPKLKALRDRVEALPKIAEWIKKRPNTPF